MFANTCMKFENVDIPAVLKCVKKKKARHVNAKSWGRLALAVDLIGQSCYIQKGHGHFVSCYSPDYLSIAAQQ